MDTRYSPVRRSPSICASTNHAAPRLACVKPVASVHPEPGSNSSLYNLYLYSIARMLSVSERLSSISFRKGCLSNLFKELKRFVSSTQHTHIKVCRFLYYFCLCKSFKELFLHASVSESGCKGTHFFRTRKTFLKKNSIFTQYFFAS